MFNSIGEFRKFALRGSVIDLAVAFTVGAAFTTIAKSLVDDLIMPPIGLMLGETDFTNKFWVLKSGATTGRPYATLADAKAAGAITMNYGSFISHVVAFLCIAIVMFLLVRTINRVNDRLESEFGAAKPEPGDPTEKKCPYCLSTVPYKAVRCAACTSDLSPAPAS